MGDTHLGGDLSLSLCGGTKAAKKDGATFVIDCTKRVEDKIMDIASLEKFLQERIKVNGKASAHNDSVITSRDRSKITVTVTSTSQLKTKKTKKKYFKKIKNYIKIIKNSIFLNILKRIIKIFH
ncbi:hypothetical protein ACJRO7_026522 [Eucalyptus globulus]|uniref:60S ribosomal protein L22 n=1 Tax=Eucalyptus globulus TaxID=34317 RepID=A0ABD3JN31_EUCGL